MAAAGKAFAVGDVETQVVSLEGRRLFVEVDEDGKGYGALDGDCDIGISRHRHLQPSTPHHHTLVAREDKPVSTIQDDSAWRDLQIRPLWLIDEDRDGAEVSALLLVAVGRSRGPNQLSIHCHTLKVEKKRTMIIKSIPIFLLMVSKQNFLSHLCVSSAMNNDSCIRILGGY